MSENVIISKLTSVESQLRNLTRTILTQDTILQRISDSLESKISKQVFTISELAIRWSCSQSHVRELIRCHRIPLVLGKYNKPRKPHCVLRSEIVKFEQRSSEEKLKPERFSPIPPLGKTARGFNPFKTEPSKGVVFSKNFRLGDLDKRIKAML